MPEPTRPNLERLELTPTCCGCDEYDKPDVLALVAYARHLETALSDLDAWASRMPDAAFNEDDPRWAWWHERPRPAALAAVPGTERNPT